MENSENFPNIGIIKYYNIIGCSFWDGDFTISKNYHFKAKFINNSIKNSINEIEKNQLKGQKDNLEKAYEMIVNQGVNIFISYY
jgi:hypothetical protein